MPRERARARRNASEYEVALARSGNGSNLSPSSPRGCNNEVEVGRLRLVLVKGKARWGTAENRAWSGRTDQNKRVVFADGTLLAEEEVNELCGGSRMRCLSAPSLVCLLL